MRDLLLKTAALILALAVCTVCFVSCGDKEDPETGSQASVDETGSVPDETASADPSEYDLSSADPVVSNDNTSYDDSIAESITESSDPGEDEEENPVYNEGNHYVFYGVSFDVPENFTAGIEDDYDLSLSFNAKDSFDSINVFFTPGANISDINGSELLNTYGLMLGEIEDTVCEYYNISGMDALKIAYTARNDALGYNMRQTQIYVSNGMGYVTVTCSSMSGKYDSEFEALIASIKVK